MKAYVFAAIVAVALAAVACDRKPQSASSSGGAAEAPASHAVLHPAVEAPAAAPEPAAAVPPPVPTEQPIAEAQPPAPDHLSASNQLFAADEAKVAEKMEAPAASGKKAKGAVGMRGLGVGGGGGPAGHGIMGIISSSKNVYIGDQLGNIPDPFRDQREMYGKIAANPVHRTQETPVSTFSIDVDTGAYANVRRLILEGRRPPVDAVRVEELINYFTYDYPQVRTKGHPFAVSTEVAPCPWNPRNQLVRIGLRATDVDKADLPPANLVFLVDVSGSMQPQERLPLLKKSLKLLVEELREQDRVSLVAYADGTGVVLEPTSGKEKSKILRAIDNLQAGGSTAGEAGIQLAYKMAEEGKIPGGINRILLGTDGDFNVGITNFDELKQLAADKRKTGISLTTLGFGVGNYNEHLMEQLADAGDGSYAYIDTLNEGHKVLVEQMTQTLAIVAKDVKIQVEFNPAAVSEYRQIGYENRALKREDFANDKVDAGEVGAGTVVTALYEVTPVGQAGRLEPLRYANDKPVEVQGNAAELAFLRVRYKGPQGGASQLLEVPILKSAARSELSQATADFRFAAAVAAFGQLLRGGTYLGDFTWQDVQNLAAANRGEDRFGYRAEFSRLLSLAKSLKVGE